MFNRKADKESYLIDKTFGRLKVVSFNNWYIKPNGNRISKWLCLCECGKTKIIAGTSLQQGLTKSCGCLAKEKGSDLGSRRVKIESGFYDLYRHYKNKCKKGIKFNLTEDEFRSLTSKNCFYCNVAPLQCRKSVAKKHPNSKDYIYNGIDRINNNEGYYYDNCVSCCGVCNKMKNNLTFLQFIKHVKRINKHLKLKI